MARPLNSLEMFPSNLREKAGPGVIGPALACMSEQVQASGRALAGRIDQIGNRDHSIASVRADVFITSAGSQGIRTGITLRPSRR